MALCIFYFPGEVAEREFVGLRAVFGQARYAWLATK
jgi:hypothetical protein